MKFCGKKCLPELEKADLLYHLSYMCHADVQATDLKNFHHLRVGDTAVFYKQTPEGISIVLCGADQLPTESDRDFDFDIFSHLLAPYASDKLQPYLRMASRVFSTTERFQPGDIDVLDSAVAALMATTIVAVSKKTAMFLNKSAVSNELEMFGRMIDERIAASSLARTKDSGPSGYIDVGGQDALLARLKCANTLLLDEGKEAIPLNLPVSDLSISSIMKALRGARTALQEVERSYSRLRINQSPTCLSAT